MRRTRESMLWSKLSKRRRCRKPASANLGIHLREHSEQQLAAAYFHDYFTDTGDTVVVRMHERSGRMLTVVSNSQLPFMLPWVVYGDRTVETTYDANVGRAAVALLPKNAASREVVSKSAVVSKCGDEEIACSNHVILTTCRQLNCVEHLALNESRYP